MYNGKSSGMKMGLNRASEGDVNRRSGVCLYTFLLIRALILLYPKPSVYLEASCVVFISFLCCVF